MYSYFTIISVNNESDSCRDYFATRVEKCNNLKKVNDHFADASDQCYDA